MSVDSSWHVLGSGFLCWVLAFCSGCWRAVEKINPLRKLFFSHLTIQKTFHIFNHHPLHIKRTVKIHIKQWFFLTFKEMYKNWPTFFFKFWPTKTKIIPTQKLYSESYFLSQISQKEEKFPLFEKYPTEGGEGLERLGWFPNFYRFLDMKFSLRVFFNFNEFFTAWCQIVRGFLSERGLGQELFLEELH